MDLPRDLIDLFSVFDAAGVRYLLVGGHAVSAHGRPRSTKDVDLWLGPERADIECACVALSEFGVPREIVEALRNSGPQDIVWLGRAPSRIDLLRSLPGVGFEARRLWLSRCRAFRGRSVGLKQSHVTAILCSHARSFLRSGSDVVAVPRELLGEDPAEHRQVRGVAQTGPEDGRDVLSKVPVRMGEHLERETPC